MELETIQLLKRNLRSFKDRDLCEMCAVVLYELQRRGANMKAIHKDLSKLDWKDCDPTRGF